MKYSLTDDFLNPKKIVYPLANYLLPYLNGENNFYPWAVEIHPTAKCNHRCIHCSYKERNESRVEMAQDIFNNLVDSLIKLKVRGVYFSGGGEPCTYKNLGNAVKKFKENGVEVALVTNGTLFEKSGMIDFAQYLNYIAVSVPSCQSEMYKKITGVELVEEVLSLPSKIKNKCGNASPIVGARVVVTNLIAKEVPDILKTLQDKNYDYALFKIVRDYEDRGLGLSEDMVAELKKEIDFLQNAGMIDPKFTNLNKIFSYRKPYNTDGLCHVNNMGLLAAVTPEGDVYPNISEIGNEKFKIGNLTQKNFEEIWNSPKHVEVKNISNEQWKEGICKNCRAISYNVQMNNLLVGYPKEEDPFV